jgi:hypothetical protein
MPCRGGQRCWTQDYIKMTSTLASHRPRQTKHGRTSYLVSRSHPHYSRRASNDTQTVSNIKVPLSSLARLNKTSIPVPQEPTMGWATLGVNHELHCLGRLRMSIFADHFYPDFTEEDKRNNRLHSLHCLDYLRQASQCHGDISLTTYYWRDGEQFPVADFESPKACVDWERIVKWQEERLWEPMSPGVLVHPTLGESSFSTYLSDGRGLMTGCTRRRRFPRRQWHVDRRWAKPWSRRSWEVAGIARGGGGNG